ncbi:MAG: TetR/AcrR family transcriptional regulator [Deltaproteobacteria bacterium]|nr:TetR/AcrR family transcriptional regulator [Deltaproteobacteria bacterium]
MMSKKEAILKAATKMFAAQGFERTPVRKIAEKVDLSVPGMFHYFPSKEDILNDIMINFMDEGYRKLKEINNDALAPVEKVEGFCKFYVDHYAGNQELLTILVSEWKYLSREHRQQFFDKQRIYVDALKKHFSDLAEQGLLKPIDPSILTLMFFGMVLWTSNWYDPRGKMGLEELGSIFREVFLRGVLKKN